MLRNPVVNLSASRFWLGLLGCALGLIAMGLVLFMEPSPASAVQSVPYRVNFQGRLTNASGNIVADGLYNMQFRLYDAASGGTVLWSETRETTNRVQVTNGLFSVQLGSVSALSPTLFNDAAARHLEITMATPATATCSTASCASWESPMTPRQALASSTYALNSDLLDGQDGSYYQDASNLTAGTVSGSRLSGSYTGVTGTGALSAGSIASGFGTIVTGNTIQGSRIISTIATGTAPLTVTSTTKVSNLNVDLLDGLDSTAFAAASGSGSYIQNTTGAQTANFNITGNGTVGGNLVAGSGINPITVSSTGISGADYGISTTSGALSISAVDDISVNSVMNVNADLTVYNNATASSVVSANITKSEVVFGEASIADTFTKLSNLPSLPSPDTRDSDFSPDGNYLAVAADNGSYLSIYKRSGDTFTKLSNPATLPTGSANGVSFSPDGQYLTVAHNTSPFVTIYKRSGDTFTKLADPGTLPTSDGVSASFSPDGLYMSVTHFTSPFVTIYKRSGDTFTKLSNPATLPNDIPDGVSFSPDGRYMTLGTGTSPFIYIYKRSGDTFTKLADPGTLPTGWITGTAFSPDGQYLSVAHGVSPFVTIYKRSGDTFTKLANPATLPPNIGTGTEFSPDGKYLTVTHADSPYVTIYTRSGDTFTKLANPATIPSGIMRGPSFSPDSQYLAMASSASPSVFVYRIGSGNSTNVTLYGALTSTGSLQGTKLDISGYTNLQGGASVLGALDVQGTGTFIQADAISRGVFIQGRVNPQFGDAALLDVYDGNGNYILHVSQHVGPVVSIRGGSGFWGTAALEVVTAEAGAKGLVVKASGGQTAQLLRVVDSSDNRLFAVRSDGTVESAGWLRTTNATGWINDTYGGGWHMSDSTWIRAWAKNVYMQYGFDTGAASGVACGGGLGGGYTFRVCGTGNVTSSMTIDGGATFNNSIWLAPPGADNGIYLCHRTSDNLLLRAWSGCSTVSSIRHKENVVSLDGDTALDLLNQLRPVGFDWKAGTGTAMDGSIHDYGLIAEEVRDILPHVVAYGANGEVTGLNYQGFIPFMMQAIKEQQSQIVRLQGGNPVYSSLAVNGPATVETLTVKGDARVKGDIFIDGHLVSGGDAPTVDTTLATCLDSVSITGTDTAGTIRFSVDSAGCTSADLRVIFAKVYGAAPHATLTAKDRISARLKSSLDTDTQKMTFTFDELQAGKTYRFTYHVIQ